MCLAAHLGVTGKMPLTDFCNRHFRNEHPTLDRPTPEPAARAAKTASTQRTRSV